MRDISHIQCGHVIDERWQNKELAAADYIRQSAVWRKAVDIGGKDKWQRRTDTNNQGG